MTDERIKEIKERQEKALQFLRNRGVSTPDAHGSLEGPRSGGGAQMTDEDRKFLTEVMGSKWIEPYFDDYADYGKGRTSLRVVDRNRSFTTWDDFGAVWEWAQKQEWWKTFINENGVYEPDDRSAGILSETWLVDESVIDSTLFPQLVVDFLRLKEVPK